MTSLILIPILFFLASLLFFGSKWLFATFGAVTADQLMFQIQCPLKGANSDLVKSFIRRCLLPGLGVSLAVFLVARKLMGTGRVLLLAASAVLLVISFAALYMRLGLSQLVKGALTDSTFFDEHYADPRSVGLTFPEQKRNLIYIYLESVETSLLPRNLGGAMEENLMPELAELMRQNVHFSHTDALGGAIQLPYTSWTVAAMVSHSAGLPLKIPVGGELFDHYKSFLPGAYTLGDILRDAGYAQRLMVGSDAEFGGRKAYYAQHGDAEILDLFAARSDGIIPPDYHVWWGYEDEKLYAYARKELLELAGGDAPFHLTMLTVDTHTVGGYRCPQCGEQFPHQYWNVAACASRQLGRFIDWVQRQDFYENTTIVIAGDHLSMESIVVDGMDKDYQRTTPAVFLNPAVQPDHTRNRTFSTMDLFPSTLAAMGVEIEGHRLALGTDLFSTTPTLLETYSKEEVSCALHYRSKRYASLL